MMNEAGAEYLSFLFHNTRPTIQKDGLKYEILDLFAPEPGDTCLSLSTIAPWGFSLHTLTIDGTARKSTWDALARLVRREIAKLER